MHPDLQEMSCRDDFGAVECILIRRKCFAGMILGGEMHPDLQEMSCRDEIIHRPCNDEIIVDYVFYK